MVTEETQPPAFSPTASLSRFQSLACFSSSSHPFHMRCPRNENTATCKNYFEEGKIRLLGPFHRGKTVRKAAMGGSAKRAEGALRGVWRSRDHRRWN